MTASRKYIQQGAAEKGLQGTTSTGFRTWFSHYGKVVTTIRGDVIMRWYFLEGPVKWRNPENNARAITGVSTSVSNPSAQLTTFEYYIPLAWSSACLVKSKDLGLGTSRLGSDIYTSTVPAINPTSTHHQRHFAISVVRTWALWPFPLFLPIFPYPFLKSDSVSL